MSEEERLKAFVEAFRASFGARSREVAETQLQTARDQGVRAAWQEISDALKR